MEINAFSVIGSRCAIWGQEHCIIYWLNVRSRFIARFTHISTFSSLRHHRLELSDHPSSTSNLYDSNVHLSFSEEGKLRKVTPTCGFRTHSVPTKLLLFFCFPFESISIVCEFYHEYSHFV